jgi:hypothetical protein
MDGAVFQLLVILFSVVLLPLVPAILLFKLLPSDATAEGPWKGLKIKVGGAFAGYFIVALLLTGISYYYVSPPLTQTEYRISGILRTDDPAARIDLNELEFFPAVDRRTDRIEEGAYQFSATIRVHVDGSGHPKWLYDQWLISHPDFYPHPIRVLELQPAQDSAGNPVAHELTAQDLILRAYSEGFQQ